MSKTKVRTYKKKMSAETKFFIFCGVFFPIANFILFYIVPNGSAFLMAFQDKNGNWGMSNFIRFFEALASADSEFRLALRNTLITFLLGLIATPFRIMVSYFIYKKIPFAGVYKILFFLPTIIVSTVVAMVFEYMVSPNGFIAEWVGRLCGLDYAPELLADSRFSMTTLWIQMLWLAFPGDLIIWLGNFTRIPTELLESGQLDGVNWFTEFTQIIVPMVWPTVAITLTMSFCGILGASTSAFLLTGGDYGTMDLNTWLTKELYNFSGDAYASNVYNYMSAVGLVITVISVLIGQIVRKICDNAFTEVEY